MCMRHMYNLALAISNMVLPSQKAMSFLIAGSEPGGGAGSAAHEHVQEASRVRTHHRQCITHLCCFQVQEASLEEAEEALQHEHLKTTRLVDL